MDLFRKTNQHFAQKLPFAVYSKPHSDQFTGVFQNDNRLHEIVDFRETGFAMVSFDGSRKILIPSAGSDIYVEKVTSEAFHYLKKSLPAADDLAKKAFETIVAKAVEAIRQGQFKKVVLSRKEVMTLKDFAVENVLSHLKSLYPTAFVYCFFHPKAGMWLGASPEQFLQVNGTHIKTVSLAGTQLWAENITWQTKEQQEQQIVTDFIKESIQEYGSDVQVSGPYTQQAGGIVHLKSDLSAVLNDQNQLGNLIRALHPTPAVCGMPKEAAKSFLLENEGYDRRFYSGFLGELNIDFASMKTDRSDLFVNLRCMEVAQTSNNESQAMIYIGCGIMADSNPEKEYIETVNKSMTMRNVLNL